MEKFSFFNDVNDDRVYYAEDWARHLKKYFTNGIFNNELNVVANNDMTITIKEGDANIEGYRYTNTGDLVKTIDNADETLNRIDNVVLRLDLTNRLISAQIIKGTFADKPVAPELVRTSTIYDLRIAKISIPAGTTTITQDLITDTRFITSDCGNVISTVQTPDTENLFIQMQTLFEKQINELNNNFETWFDSMKNQLSSDAAGNLQNQINNLNSKKVDNATYDIDSNNLQLLANGKNVGDSVHIPTGITDTAIGEEDLKIVNNRGVVKFSLEGKTEQKSYTGKNILPHSLSQGSWNTTSTNTRVANYSNILIKPGTYTFSTDIDLTNYVVWVGTGTQKFPQTNWNIVNEIKSWSAIEKITFTIEKESYFLVMYRKKDDSTITPDEIKDIKQQLEIGSEVTEFEPYVGGIQSPNPDYPQEIENISGVENLLEINCDNQNEKGIELINNNDGSVTLNGTSSAKSGGIRLIKNNTSFSVKNLPSEVTFSLSEPLPSGVELAMAYGDENGTWVKNIVILKNNDISKSIKLDIPNNAKYIRFNFTIESGIVLNNITFRPLLEKGNKQHYFVPNGSNYLQLENVGENILNIDETPFTVKKITSQGNVLYWSGYSGVNDFVKVKEKTTYKFSSNEVNKVCYIDYYDKNKNYLSRTGTAVDYFTTPENCKYIKFAINLELIPTNAQLREGTIIKSYEPYKKKIINIDLKGNELCSDKEQTSKDELIIENGRAKIIKKYDEVILTGSESGWERGTSTSGNYYYQLNMENIKPAINNTSICNIKCSHFESKSANDIWAGIKGISVRVNISSVRFCYVNDKTDTLEKWKAYLQEQYNAGNPVKIQYELETPEVIDLGKIDFELLEGNSTLNLEEDLKSNMSIKYYIDSTVVDLKKKLENKQNVILHGTTVPSNDLGEDGDIYLQHN